jgi:hypothetical protein
MELKHTKGNHYAKDHHIFVEGKSFPIGQSFLMSCALKPDGTMEEDLESLANAKLWASSKDLLEALIELYESIDSCVDLTPEVLNKAKSAIQKATS